jgi:hypothetical protein
VTENLALFSGEHLSVALTSSSMEALFSDGNCLAYASSAGLKIIMSALNRKIRTDKDGVVEGLFFSIALSGHTEGLGLVKSIYNDITRDNNIKSKNHKNVNIYPYFNSILSLDAKQTILKFQDFIS